MSKLEQLINKLCPNGVEYKTLSDVLKIKNGKDYKQFKEGNIPVYGSGGIIAYIDVFVLNKPSVLIPRKGSIDKLYYVEKPFWTVDTIFYTEIYTDIVIPKFVFYYLQKEHLEKYNIAGGVPSLTQAVLNKISFPIPPLPVQEEIVRILDTFAELTTELTTELTMRKQQYEYYRETLFNFENSNTKFVPMGDQTIGKFTRGSGLQKKDFTNNGVGCIHYGQIYTYYGTYAIKTKTFVSEEFAKKSRIARHGDLIIATTSENDEDVCKAVAWLGNEGIAISGDACFYTHKLNPKYVAYFFQTEQFQKQKRLFITGTKVRRVNVSALEKILIPVPPLEEQQRIVDILDRFDTLVNDIKIGLPAEIEARQRQYEYYRDKLLTFKK